MNDYHAAFKQMCEDNSYKGQQWFGKRQYLVERYGWAVPNSRVLGYITSTFDRVNEVGAGDGYWAKCLDDRGTNVDAYDTKVSSEHYDVTCQDANELTETIAESPLLLVWPPVNKPLAENMARMRPSHILYVGEMRGGCTADDGFFDVLDQFYGLIEEINIPSYEGVNDNFYHYARKI